ADLSAAPSGAFTTLVDLLRLILGLGYLALDNAQNGTIREWPLIARLVTTFVALFYGVIAPLNLFLFFGALVLLGDEFLFSLTSDGITTEIVLGSLGAILAGGGWLYARREGGKSAMQMPTYLTRCLGYGLAFLGTLSLSIALLTLLGADLNFGRQFIPECANPSLSHMAGISCFVAASVGALHVAWTVAVVLLVLISVLRAGTFWKDFGVKRAIYLSICAAMLLFWLTITVALWSLFQTTATEFLARDPFDGVGPPRAPVLLLEMLRLHFAPVSASLTYVVPALLILFVCAGVIYGARAASASRLALAPDSPRDRWLGRLLLNPILNGVLTLSVGLVALGVVSGALGGLRPLFEDGDAFTWPALVERLYISLQSLDLQMRQMDWLITPFVAVLGVFLVRFPDTVGGVVGIARDIVSYSTRSHASNPRLSPDRSTYLHRDRIQARFETVVTWLLDQNTDVTRITVLSHSQGTVVAHQTLQGMDLRLPVTLVTMGSPLGHVYAHYFGQNYQILRPFSVSRWVNIFRADDYVGTWIRGAGAEVTNVRIDTGGHLGYWTDREVWGTLKALSVIAPDRPPKPVRTAKTAAPAAQDTPANLPAPPLPKEKTLFDYVRGWLR
ncbi:MAG: hypothetical protein AAGK57_07955, partial [Pseudomonadota bacterium]